VAITQCIKGHYYDDTKQSTCPYCSSASFEEDSPTISAKNRIKVQGRAESMKPQPEDDKTIAITGGKTGFDPVVGWLVCTKGPERGRDYRLHSGQNFLGRSLKMSVVVQDDESISRDKHCSFIYDPKSCQFFIAPEKGNTVFKNDALVKSAMPLREGDLIGIGESIFEFVPFCKEGNNWS